MNKTDLIAEVAGKTGLSKTATTEAVDATFEAIMGAVAKGDTANFVGFGSFKVSERAARTGRNPQTGATIEIAASKLPKFTPGAGFKSRLNGD